MLYYLTVDLIKLFDCRFDCRFVGSVQFSSILQSCLTLWTPWTATHQASVSITNSWSPPEPMSIELVMPSNHLILCHPLLFLPSIFPSFRTFSNESVLHIRWPKYWSFSNSPFNKYSGFPLGLTGLLSLQPKELSRLFSNNTVRNHQFYGAQPTLCFNSYLCPYMTTGKP